MNACDEWLERISRKMDGELPPEEAALLASHLAGCPSCREAERGLREDERRVVAALSRAVESVSLPDLAAAVLARVRSERGRSERGNGGGPARWGVRFACMVGFFGAAAAALLALVRGPEAPPAEPEAVSTPVAVVPSAEPAMGLGIGLVDAPAGKMPAGEPGAFANEAEAIFIYAQNGLEPGDLSSVQVAIDQIDLIGRADWLQSLPPDAWGNPEAVSEIANLGQNLRLVRDATPDSVEALSSVQWAISNNGALQSCDNLRIAVGYGSNYVRVTRNLEQSLPVEAKPDARLFLSTYDSLAAGDSQGALAACDRILAEHPESPWVDDALFKKGQIYEYHLGDYARASEAYQTLLARDPGSNLANDCQMNYARTQLRQENRAWGASLGQTRAVQNQVLMTQQDVNSNRLFQLATARIGFLESNMADPVALGLYLDAEASLERGNRDAAIARIEELLARHAGAPIRDEALYLKGEILRREGKQQEALKVWQSCIDEIPDSRGAQYALEGQKAVEGYLQRLELHEETK